jgi:hypothetical protein
MVGVTVKLDARARELVPGLVAALGDSVELVERDGDLPRDPVVTLAGRPVTTAAADGAIVLAPMPGDRQGAASSFVLALHDGTAVVPELEQGAFDAIGLVHERSLGRLVQTFLDVQVAELEQLGVAVQRLPMLAPVDLERVPDRPESWVGTFVSPAQTLLVGGAGDGRAFCPRLDESRFDEAYRALAESHRARWRALFEDKGYAVSFVDVGGLVPHTVGLRSLVVA